MNVCQKYISYKKVLLFGETNSGKSSLILRLEKDEYSNSISSTEECKAIIYIITNKIYFNYSIKVSFIRT